MGLPNWLYYYCHCLHTGSLEKSLEEIWAGKKPLAGSKLDVEKFFESCNLEQALAFADGIGIHMEEYRNKVANYMQLYSRISANLLAISVKTPANLLVKLSELG